MLSTKQHYNKEFFHLLSAIKKALTKNQEMLFFKKTNDHSTVLQLLVKEGFISSFQNNTSFLVIRLKLFKGTNTKSIHVLKFAQRVGHKNYTISFKELLLLQQKEGVSSYFVLLTDQGLLTSFLAIEKCIGGKLLFKIS
jgi:ribosomal protein S8